MWYTGTGTSNKRYLLADERGSIVSETNATGGVVTTHRYGPYGEPINQSASRFRYTGQILLPGTELYHYKARVYHPKLGRFMQTDPIGYEDGMNWYAYGGNDPVNMTDPSGLCGRFKGDRGCGGYKIDGDVSDLTGGASEKGGIFEGNGKDDSDIKTSLGLQGGVKLGVKGISAAVLEVKTPVIETSLISGKRYATESYALKVDIGKWSFGYEVKRSIRVRMHDVKAGRLIKNVPFEGGFKFGSYGVNSSEFGVFEVGFSFVGSVEATFDFADGL